MKGNIDYSNSATNKTITLIYLTDEEYKRAQGECIESKRGILENDSDNNLQSHNNGSGSGGCNAGSVARS